MKIKNFVRSFALAMFIFCFGVTSITSQTPQAAAECAQEMIAHYIGDVAPANVGCALNLAIYLRSLHGFEESIVLREAVTTAFTSCYPALPNSNAIVNKIIDNLDEVNDVNATIFGGSSCLEDMWANIDAALAEANASAQRQAQTERDANNMINNAASRGAWTYADPHIKTLDGAKYHFQAEGIFTSLISTNGKFEIQTLQKGLQPKPASQNEAVAIRYGKTTLNFAVKNRSVYLNGKTFSPTSTNTKIGDGLEISQILPNAYRIVTSKGDSIIVRFQTTFLDVFLMISPFNIGVIKGGIMGNADFNSKNDLTTRTGEIIAYQDRFNKKSLYQNFGNSWRIEPAKSLFAAEILSLYPKFDVNFPEKLVDVMTFTNAAKKQAATICQRKGITDEGILEDCIHDLALTNNPAFADSAEFAQKVKRNPRDFFRPKTAEKGSGFRGSYTFDYVYSNGAKQTANEYEVAVGNEKSALRYKLKNGVSTRFIINHAEQNYLSVTDFEGGKIQSIGVKKPFAKEMAREEPVEKTRTETTKTIAGYLCRKYVFAGRSISGEVWVAESLKQTQMVPIEYLLGTTGGFAFMATIPKFLSMNSEGMVLEAVVKQQNNNFTFRVKSINAVLNQSLFDLTGVKIIGR